MDQLTKIIMSLILLVGKISKLTQKEPTKKEEKKKTAEIRTNGAAEFYYHPEFGLYILPCIFEESSETTVPIDSVISASITETPTALARKLQDALAISRKTRAIDKGSQELFPFWKKMGIQTKEALRKDFGILTFIQQEDGFEILESEPGQMKKTEQLNLEKEASFEKTGRMIIFLFEKMFQTRKEAKSFYTKEEILDLLICYHEEDDQEIKNLHHLKFFVSFENYHMLRLIQKYDIVQKNKENNDIIFKDSNDLKDQVYVEVEYRYFNKDDIRVHYLAEQGLYDSSIYHYKVKNNVYLTLGYCNPFEDSKKTTRIQNEGITREEYTPISYFQLFDNNQGFSQVQMYSYKRRLTEKYQSYNLRLFDYGILRDFEIKRDCIRTQYNDIPVTIQLELNESNVRNRVRRAASVLEARKYQEWLHHEIEGIYALYGEWYNEIDCEEPFFDDIEEYQKNYYLVDIVINSDDTINAAYMDTVDSFYGHTICIDIDKLDNISKFELYG